MIKRVVKMTFQPDRVDDFLRIFDDNQHKIRHFPGCHHLELWRCQQPDNIFFTYSFWENEEQLEKYRHSEVFRHTWSQTKQLFIDRPEAWSVQMIREAGTAGE